MRRIQTYFLLLQATLITMTSKTEFLKSWIMLANTEMAFQVKDIGLNIQEIPLQMDLAANLDAYVFWGAEQCLNDLQNASSTP